MATNTFGYIIAPHDISPSNVRNLTTPGLENCFEYPNYRAPSELDWDGFATLIAEERYERITTEECIGYLSKALPAGTKALVALATDISVNDDSSNAILSTDIMGGMNGVSVVGRFPSGDQISGNPIYAIQARLSVDGPDKSLVFQNNFTSKRACMDSGGEKSACAHASDISDLLDTKSLSSFTEVNEYISNQGILDVKAEERFRCRSDGSQSSSQDHTIDGCLAIPDEMHCKLIYSPPFYIVIILSSLGKTVAVFLAARLLRSQSAPLLTTGDAISSFISRPDPTTVGMCWLSRADVQRGAWKKKTSSRPEPSAARTDAAESLDNTHEVQFKQLPRPKFWMQAPSIHQLALTTIMYDWNPLCLVLSILLTNEANKRFLGVWDFLPPGHVFSSKY